MYRLLSPLILDFEELKSEANVIVNCAGLGAKKLTEDPFLYPKAGQIVSIDAKHALDRNILMYYDDENENGVCYIIPRK